MNPVKFNSLILDPEKKVELSRKVAERWKCGEISVIGQASPPEQPPRDEMTVIDAFKSLKLGKGGSTKSKIAILHSLASIEQWAIDLAWDIIARFSTFTLPNGELLPRAFFTDFIKVATDEAKHFSLLKERIEELGSYYGSLPIHSSLWDSALETSHSLLARLAIVHMVHEARGLDVNPQTIQKFARTKDEESVKLLEIIHSDEITHVACGERWFAHVCDHLNLNRYEHFHEMVKLHFRGPLKPPFNEEDRLKAGLDPNYYLPVSVEIEK
jgi:uncharacterized ferritin-like protein (DUF455 family)